jgi:aarF domain-containing kinase
MNNILFNCKLRQIRFLIFRSLTTFPIQDHITQFNLILSTRKKIKQCEQTNHLEIITKTLEKKSELVKDSYIVQKAKKIWRYVKRLFTYFLVGTPLAGLLGIREGLKLFNSKYDALDNLIWTHLINSLNLLGPFFIKFGQWMSTRPDLFTEELIAKLESLQSSVDAPYDVNKVNEFLEEMYGKEFIKKMQYNSLPIGSGSVGTVFRGNMTVEILVEDDISLWQELKDYLNLLIGGTVVQKSKHVEERNIPIAIKTIHPMCKEIVETDMEILTMFAEYLDSYKTFKMLAFGETLKKFSQVMNSQLNLNNEGRNLRTFSKNFKDEPNIIFPQYIGSSNDILIESYIDGIQLKEIIGNEKYKDVYEKVSMNILDSVIKMFFTDNFIHGDLHPGNLLVDLSDRNSPKICILDSGITYNFLNKNTHQKIANIAFLLMLHKGYDAGLLLVEQELQEKLKMLKQYYNSTNFNMPIDKELQNAYEFCKGVEEIVEDCKKENVFKNASNYTDKLLRFAKKSNIKLDSDFLQLLLALKVVEGIFLSLTPEMTMINSGIKLLLPRLEFSNIKLLVPKLGFSNIKFTELTSLVNENDVFFNHLMYFV